MIKFLFLVMLSSVLIVSCTYAELDQKNDRNEAALSPSSPNGTLVKIRKGTNLFQNCKLTLPCGPCRGICIKLFGIKSYDGGPLGDDVIADATLINNDTIFQCDFGNIDMSDFNTGNAKTIIDEDFDVDQDVALSFGKNKITILEGEYSINNGIILFDCSTN